ncbi:MAG: stage II sporulation protein M [Candidatus Bathyarchaeota archaeon]|nr:stage II sporulation protein M [Candidatus Bathyarchaeota archaeon]
MVTSRQGQPTGLLGIVFGRQAGYVRRLAPLFILCLTGYVFSLIVGYQMGDSISESILDDLMAALPDLEGMDMTMIFLFVLFNNITKSFIWMVLGIVGSFPPLYFSIMNGFLLGSFSYSIVLEHSMAFTAAALVPHGIIEVPTILLSSAAGMGLGYQLINRLRGRGNLRVEFAMALRLFITRIIPLLLLAALIEFTLTPLLVAFLGFA